MQRGWLGISINYRLCNGGYGGPSPSPDSVTWGTGASVEGPHRIGDRGNLVCQEYGNFPKRGPFGNASCNDPGLKVFGLGTSDGCALSGPPKNCSFFGTLMSWMYPSVRDAKAAVRWVRANADSLNIDPESVPRVRFCNYTWLLSLRVVAVRKFKHLRDGTCS